MALAEIYEGGSRGDAARVGGVGLRIIRAKAERTGYVQVSRTPGAARVVGHDGCGVGEAPRHEIAGSFTGCAD